MIGHPAAAARIAELEAELAALKQKGMDDLRVLLATTGARNLLQAALGVAERRFCEIGSAGCAPEKIQSVCETAVGDIEEALARAKMESAIAASDRHVVLREVLLQLRNCGSLRDFGEYEREIAAEIGEVI